MQLPWYLIPFAVVGSRVNAFLLGVGELNQLFWQTLYWTFIAPFRGKTAHYRETCRQLDVAGIQSLPIVCLVTFLIGVVLILQTAHALEKYGQINQVPALVAVSLVREFGPLMTAIILTGRVGASYTAELGTMKVSEEILALDTMAINPIGFLISPRLLAMLIAFPCLTILGDIMGMFGGGLTAYLEYGIQPAVYISSSLEALSLTELAAGLSKSFFFAGILVFISCYFAFSVEGGPEGVGKASMLSVVSCLVLILVVDALYTAFTNIVLKV